MKNYPLNTTFHRDIAEKYAAETDIFCSVCGDGIYPDESVSWDEHNQICHAECVEEENEDGSKKTC